MGKQIGLGIAGCGASVQMYGPALRYLEGAQVVAWMDPLADKAQEAATRYGGQAYTDYAAFLAHPGLDAVILASPPWLHLPQARQAAEAGKHVLCEKPMARNVTECRALTEAVEGQGRILMVGFMKRFSPYFRKVKEMVDAGDLGELIEIRTEWGWPQYFLAGWRDKRDNLGGLFLDHGSHTIDLCRWWAGDILSASAEVRIHLQGREVEDYAQATYRHSSGCISTHYNSRLTHKPLRECYTIEGTKGALTLECRDKWSFNSLDPFVMKRYTLGREETITLPGSPNIEDQVAQSWMYLGSLRYFVDCVQRGAKPAMCSGADGLAVIEAIDAAYIASSENRVVTLPLTEPYDLDALFRRMQTLPHRGDVDAVV